MTEIVPTWDFSELDSIKKSIADKMEDGNLTSEELADLRKEINCLSPDAVAQLRTFIDAQFAQVRAGTRRELDSLLVECRILPEKQQSADTFGRVFEGTRSDMLSKDHVQGLKMYILSKFEKFHDKLNDQQRDNIATAVIDRLLSDKAFSGIVGDISTSLTNAIGTMEKEGITGVLGTLTTENTEEKSIKEKSTKEKVESSAMGFNSRIAEIINSAVDPLVHLLDQNPSPAGLSGFLNNPRAIAEYKTKATIPANIVAMNDGEKTEYIHMLHNKVLEIDGKIIPLETIREKGMDFVAVAPDWMQKIFMWLLDLPFIGNLLASFLEYKDGTEAISGMGEELRQRRSIVTLREFGKVTNMEGKTRDGKFMGKIGILKDVDLSKLDRKQLSDFFKFTVDKWIDSTTPDFWIGVFEKGEIVTTMKDKDGKGLPPYIIEPPIEAKDCEKDFQGLYEKLNNLKKITEEAESKARAEASKNEKANTEANQKAELATKKIGAEKAGKGLKPIKDIALGLIINTQVVEKLSSLTVDDLVNGTYTKKVETLWGKDQNRDDIIRVLGTYASLLSTNEKVRAYVANLKTTMNGPMDLATLSHQRLNILAIAGYTAEWMKQQEGKIVEAKTAGKEMKNMAEKTDYLKQRDMAIVHAISQTSVFPIPLPVWNEANVKRGRELGVEYPKGDMSYDPNTERFSIGEKHFSLSVKPFKNVTWGIETNITDAKITNIRVNGDHFELMGKSEKYGEGKDPIKVSKSDMSEFVIALLNGKTDTYAFADKITVTQINTLV